MKISTATVFRSFAPITSLLPPGSLLAGTRRTVITFVDDGVREMARKMVLSVSSMV